MLWVTTENAINNKTVIYDLVKTAGPAGFIIVNGLGWYGYGVCCAVVV